LEKASRILVFSENNLHNEPLGLRQEIRGITIMKKKQDKTFKVRVALEVLKEEEYSSEDGDKI